MEEELVDIQDHWRGINGVGVVLSSIQASFSER